MLVDLGRNDLGRIARVGSVEVERYLEVLHFSHVMHLGSTVAADIAPEHDALDAVDAILPAGTLSGAPKLRVCQIIRELEGASMAQAFVAVARNFCPTRACLVSR